MRRSLLILTIALTAALAGPRTARAVKVADVTRLAGARTNVLTGMGLVIGLNNTGDSGAYLPAARPLANMLAKFGDPVAPPELAAANNVAIVAVSATIPADGVRTGDHLDVRVMSIGNATSLRGGVLYMSPLLGPTGQPYTPHAANKDPLPPVPFALANGLVELGDATVPTNGVVKGGAVMEVDLLAKYVDERGRFTLILDGQVAAWETAGAIARQINDLANMGEAVAAVVDPRNVVVQIPAGERDRPDRFISSVLRLPIVVPPREAEAKIDGKSGSTESLALQRFLDILKQSRQAEAKNDEKGGAHVARRLPLQQLLDVLQPY